MQPEAMLTVELLVQYVVQPGRADVSVDGRSSQLEDLRIEIAGGQNQFLFRCSEVPSVEHELTRIYTVQIVE